MCEGASKQSSDLKNYTGPRLPPLVLKFPDPPLLITKKIAPVWDVVTQ